MIMKLIQTLLASLFLCPIGLMAQVFDGNWTGQLANQSGSLTSEMSLKSAGNQLSGELIVLANTGKDSYILQGTITANKATGKLIYQDGTVFELSMQYANGQITQTISYQGQPILQGSFTKKGKTNPTAAIATKPDNLHRDPQLVGHWVHSTQYSSSGFYGGTSSVFILNSDGTLDDGGATSYASGSGNSAMSKGGGDQTIAQLKSLGARWFTKGNIFCWQIPINGKITTVESARYYVENGSLSLTDLQTGKKTLYQRK